MPLWEAVSWPEDGEGRWETDCWAKAKLARSELVSSRFDFSKVGRRPMMEGPPFMMLLDSVSFVLPPSC